MNSNTYSSDDKTKSDVKSSHQHENILVATIGISPAVLTETVWALAHRSPPVIIDRVNVITTLRGERELQDKLLSGQPSVWQRLQQVLREKGLPVEGKLNFEPADIRVIEANGQRLEDIRSTNDNRAVGDQILRLLWELSANPNRTIYASLAGGRKTMSSLILTAMTVCARPQDRVLHVLVNEPFESPQLSPPFFFPDPNVDVHTYTIKGEPKSVSPQEARIELAEIPIPSFREFSELLPETDCHNLTLESVSHIIRRGSEEAVTQRFFNRPISVDECLQKTPLLRWLGETLPNYHRGQELPFSQYHVLLVLHCLSNLISFTWTLEQLGLKRATYFIKQYPYPQKKPIHRWLKEKGYQTVNLNESKLTDYLSQISVEKKPLLIVEDGGWITKAILEQFPDLRPYVAGVMEQTTKGLWRIEEAIKKLPERDQSQLFPILLLPHSQHKLNFEPPHIGRGIVRAIDQMIPDYLDGMQVGLFGYGTIGQKVADALADMGARVTVYDPSWTSKSRQSGHTHVSFANTHEEAVENKRLIIGCSGRVSIDDKVIAMIRSNGKDVYLASGSSERVEIDLDSLERMAKRRHEYRHEYLMVGGELLLLGTRYELPLANVVLLGDGMPVNFMGLGGMKDPAADFIMSLMLAGAYELARRQVVGSGLVCSKDNSCIDRITDQLGIEAKFNEILGGGY